MTCSLFCNNENKKKFNVEIFKILLIFCFQKQDSSFNLDSEWSV